MLAVAVTWGRIHDRARLEAEQPDAIVDTAEELLGVL
jgi:phosphoglycolate phosphatase-like HAD superfamily hydrolase